jgi:hypothetical protein
MSKYLTIKDLMVIYNKSYVQVWYAVRTDKIEHIRVGWQYLIPKDTLPEIWPIEEG